MKSFVLASIITVALVVSVVVTVMNVDSGDKRAEAGSDISAEPSLLLTGNWLFFFLVVAGFGDAPFIGMPEEFEGDIVTFSIFDEDGARQPAGSGGIAMSVEADPPFVNVSGFAQVDGSFFLTGIGTVAGFENITVEFEGTIEFPGILNGEYTMGAAGELPLGMTVYEVMGEKVVQVTPTPSPTPSPTPEPGQLALWGDPDCDNDSDAVDALKTLQHVAAIGFTQTEPCPDVGASVAVTAGAQQRLWGDVDCDGDVDAVDALKLLRNVAALSVDQEPGCPAIGSEILVS
ncbi:MAG: hypothetical protein IH957_08690 [Chloroflexi bacterium]|nr:hypothetical protein [Chloroflexota bacterium]